MARRIIDIDGWQDETGEFVFPDVDEVVQTAAEIVMGLKHMGGTVTVGTKRQKVGPDRGVTVGWTVMVDSFAPMTEPEAPSRKSRLEEPPADEQPADADAVLEPVGVEG